jgi:DNA-binding CsgD family transcriptional regulator
VVQRLGKAFRSGDPVVAFEPDLAIVAWNAAAEDLTGVSADNAIGRRCWEVLGGHDERGNLVCHPGCAYARLAREGWPVPCAAMRVRTREGMRRVDVSTLALEDADHPLFLHVLVPHHAPPRPGTAPVLLTPRQRQVLRLLADGVPAKVIAGRLGLAEATVRNHIRAILAALDAHSQLEAVAKARRFQLIA